MKVVLQGCRRIIISINQSNSNYVAILVYFIKFVKGVCFIKKLNENDIKHLKYALSSGIIDLACILEQSANMKRSMILDKHKTEYWHSKGREDCWYWRNPDREANPKRSKVKRKKRDDIEQIVVDYYLELERQKELCINRESMTFEELFYEFIENKKSKRASGTIKRNTSDWKKFIKPHDWFINMLFRDIKKLDVDKLFNTIIKEHQMNDKTFGNVVGLVKQAYQYAIEADYIDKSPYRINVNKELVEVFHKKDSKLEVFQPHEKELLINEQERRLQNNPSNTANLAIILCFEIGARKGEILALRESDIDYDKRVLTISRQFVDNDVIDDIENIKRIGYKVTNRTKGRTGKSRKVPLTEKALETIGRIKQINKEFHEPYEDYLFIRNGYIIPPTAIDTQLVRGCEYIGLRFRSMHKIRKTYASTLYKQGVDIMTISKLLGHQDVKTTYDNYIYDLEDEDEIFKDVVNALQSGDLKPVSKKVTKSDQKIINFQEMKRRKTS